jgi:hypothetical protein
MNLPRHILSEGPPRSISVELCVLKFGPGIHWRVSLSDPLLYDIHSHPGVQLVTPLLFPEIENLMDAKRPDGGVLNSESYIGPLCLIETDGIAFAIDEVHASLYKPKDVARFACFRSDTPPLSTVFTPLLNALRHFSKQADLPTGPDDVQIWEWLCPPGLPARGVGSPSKLRRAVAKSIVETAVTRAHIESACNCGPEFSVPIFDTLLLDAISAHASHDYRKSILYSAIAVESAASIVLEDRFENHIKLSNSQNWRVIEIPQSGGKTIRKDPIWSYLRKRENANALFHEGALYVLGRSLMLENDPLYQFMERLRSTRNKIVHLGEPPEQNSSQYLSIDQQGSSDALNCANEVLKWLGVGNEYKLHESGMVEVSNVPTE